jgi:uncharacterized membrane protein YfcA
MDVTYLALIALVGTIVGTVTGFGTSTIMIPVLLLYFPPIEAIFLVSIIHYFGDIWKVMLFREGFNWKLIALFGVVGMIPSYIGASISINLDKTILLRLMGAFFIAYFAFLVFKSKFKIGVGTKTAVLGGVFAGFSAGVFGLGGPIRAAVLSAYDMPKAVFIATGAVIGLMVDAARMVAYFMADTPLPSHLRWSLGLFIVLSFIGAQIGKYIVDKIPQEKFRNVIAAFLFLLGVKLVMVPVTL